MSIKVFTKPACVQCNATYRFLNAQGIDYDVVDVTKDQSAFDKVKTLGHRQMPVVYVDEQTHWSGFRPELIKGLVA